MSSRMDVYINNIKKTPKSHSCLGILDSSDGKKANIKNLSDSQVRDVYCMMPYGISSRITKGSKAQVIINGENHNSVVGVYDPKRPKVDIGEVMLYSAGDAKIYLKKNGDIIITGTNIIINGVNFSEHTHTAPMGETSSPH